MVFFSICHHNVHAIFVTLFSVAGQRPLAPLNENVKIAPLPSCLGCNKMQAEDLRPLAGVEIAIDIL